MAEPRKAPRCYHNACASVGNDPVTFTYCYLPHLAWLDFWRLDFASKVARQLTRLEYRGVFQTFDITPDGKHIVFDRLQNNSDVVLIDLPGR